VLKLQLHPIYSFKLSFDEVSLYKNDSVLDPMSVFTFLIDLLFAYITLCCNIFQECIIHIMDCDTT
jgi:hypothetical protein